MLRSLEVNLLFSTTVYLGAKIRLVNCCTGWPMIKTTMNAAGHAIFHAFKKFIKKSSDQPKFINVINIVIINESKTDMIAVLTILNLRFMVFLPIQFDNLWDKQLYLNA